MCLSFLSVGTPPDLMCTTGPGLLGCKEILHASFKSDPQRIQKNCKKILSLCENKQYGSVAFPAINTGLYRLYVCVPTMSGCVYWIQLKPNLLMF